MHPNAVGTLDHPQLGDIRRGDELGHAKSHLYMWIACPRCHEERWVRLRSKIPVAQYCRQCWGRVPQNQDKLMAARRPRFMEVKSVGTIEQPQIGDTRKGNELGYVDNGIRIYRPCTMCKKAAWVPIYKRQPKTTLCPPCSVRDPVRNAKLSTSLKTMLHNKGPLHSKWKGGRIIGRGGYALVWLAPNDFYYPMVTRNRYALEHRIVMARHLGRCLTKFEVVHHKNGIRDDNRIENLELSTASAHIKDHSIGYNDGFKKGLSDGREKRIQSLEYRIGELETDNCSLRARVTLLESERTLQEATER